MPATLARAYRRRAPTISETLVDARLSERRIIGPSRSRSACRRPRSRTDGSRRYATMNMTFTVLAKATDRQPRYP
jgi:hypothetical protein